MSIERIKKEVLAMLRTSEPEIVCISGSWGVGKTYAWREYIKEARAERGGIFLKKYSYVSLFGIDSLAEFRDAIFQSMVNASDAGAEVTLESWRENAKVVLKRPGRASLSLLTYLNDLPYLRHIKNLNDIMKLSFFLVREAVVCIDDLERRGDKLPLRDVFGLITQLKEQKRCKVVLILNEGELGKDKEDFDKYFEKVIDTRLVFEPTPKESARIALTSYTRPVNILADCCVRLGISNIRVIKRIERLVLKAVPLLKGFDDRVTKQAVESLALLGWSYFQPGQAPSLDYLVMRENRYLSVGKREKSPDEIAWDAKLDQYGFGWMDDFDKVLLEGIPKGYFDEAVLQEHASKLSKTAEAVKAEQALTAAWKVFHHSFADNKDEVADSLYKATREHIYYVNPSNLGAAVTLLKDLGRPEQAQTLIEEYVNARGNRPELYDLSMYYHLGEEIDPDVREEFDAKIAAIVESAKPADILLKMARQHSWNKDDIALLNNLSSYGYYNLFKTHSDPELSIIIRACLMFGPIINAPDEEKEVSRRAREALVRIGEESPLNAHRIRKYGVKIEPSA